MGFQLMQWKGWVFGFSYYTAAFYTSPMREWFGWED